MPVRRFKHWCVSWRTIASMFLQFFNAKIDTIPTRPIPHVTWGFSHRTQTPESEVWTFHWVSLHWEDFRVILLHQRTKRQDTPMQNDASRTKSACYFWWRKQRPSHTQVLSFVFPFHGGDFSPPDLASSTVFGSCSGAHEARYLFVSQASKPWIQDFPRGEGVGSRPEGVRPQVRQFMLGTDLKPFPLQQIISWLHVRLIFLPQNRTCWDPLSSESFSTRLGKFFGAKSIFQIFFLNFVKYSPVYVCFILGILEICICQQNHYLFLSKKFRLIKFWLGS